MADVRLCGSALGTRIAACAMLLCLGACDALLSRAGIPDLGKQAAAREAEARAVGAACRQAHRALEDCYARAPRLPMAAVLAGWRELDEYLREHDTAR